MDLQVTNTGNATSDVVVLCFAQLMNATNAPRTQLVGFERVSNVEAGQEVGSVLLEVQIFKRSVASLVFASFDVIFLVFIFFTGNFIHNSI